MFWNDRTNQWVLTRFHDVSATLRDRRLGRSYSHLYTHAEVGRPEPDPRWAASTGTSTGRCSASNRPTTPASGG